MSRSYKHTPSCHIVKKDTDYKKIYNRWLRRKPINLDDLDSKPSNYKKKYESYFIDDWTSTTSWKEWWNNGHPRCEWCCEDLDENGNTIEKNCRNCFEKYNIRK